VTDLPPELEPIVLAVLEQRVKEAKAAARAVIEHRYAEGTRNTIRSPLDQTKLGLVYRTDPDPAWRVTDREALCKHLEQDPDNVEYVDDIAGTNEQVVEVLAEHAPWLLARVERVRQGAINAAVNRAANGQPPEPGIERVKPRGSLVVRPDKAAGPAIERMVAAGVLTWDGRLLELPAGTSEEPSQPVTNEHTQGPRPDGTWGCACGWVQDKPHAEHVADMAAKEQEA
jgi:hypothetical protein